jgi:hypothetical protein
MQGQVVKPSKENIPSAIPIRPRTADGALHVILWDENTAKILKSVKRPPSKKTLH